MQVEELEEKKESLSTDITKLNEKIDDLVDENLKLKDVLYGCCECGLYSCECEDDAENDLTVREDDGCSPPPSEIFSQSAITTSETPAPQHHPPPNSQLNPWTPPPTPPCEGCGGVNYGPSPSNLCFVCIPPLECKSQPSRHSSPSGTPPGSPPTQRLVKEQKEPDKGKNRW